MIVSTCTPEDGVIDFVFAGQGFHQTSHFHLALTGGEVQFFYFDFLRDAGEHVIEAGVTGFLQHGLPLFQCIRYI